MQSMVSYDVGIDVAAQRLVVVLAVADRPRTRAVTVTNDAAGWQAQLRRAKTDAVDAALLIAYLDGISPPPWQPPEAEIAALQLWQTRHATAHS